MSNMTDLLGDKKEIIGVSLLILVIIVGATAFVFTSQGGSLLMNSDDTNDNNDTSDTGMTDTEDSNESAGEEKEKSNNAEEDPITTEYIEGSKGELRDVSLSESSTGSNPVLEFQVGPTTRVVSIVSGETTNSEVYSITQERVRDSFEVDAPQTNGTFSGVYYVWLTDGNGDNTKYRMEVDEENLF
jgi:hypothetical protein